MRNIFIFVLLIPALVLSNSPMTCEESRKLDDTCGSYCFQAVKPILETTAVLQDQINKQNAKQETDIKIELEHIKQQLSTVIEQTVKRRSNVFKKIGSKYYYIEDSEQLNWFAAAHRCHDFGGHLVILQNKKEAEDLQPHLSKQFYWTDINDLSNENQFLSLTTGRAAPYLIWKDSLNPDNIDNEDCVLLYAFNLRMNDYNCLGTFNFICESPINN